MWMCPVCNASVEEGSAFCPSCGVQFATSESAAAETTVLTADMLNASSAQQPVGPGRQLKTNRSFIKTLLLSVVTLGIYAIVTYGQITDDVNLVCSRYDGKKSMNYYLLIFIVTPLTCGIASIVWMHNICERIGNELSRRQIDYSFGAKDFWLWGVIGSLILVGPFVFAHKFFAAVNKMNESYNQIG